MADGHRRRESFRARITRTVLNELVEIGVQASQDRFPGVLRFAHRELHGAAISLSVAPAHDIHNAVEDVGVLYFVLPPDVDTLSQDWVFLDPYITITRRRSFPVFGPVTGINLKTKGSVFNDLAERLTRDQMLVDKLMACVDKWKSIELVPILVGSGTWPPGALAVTNGCLSGPSTDLFECYNLIGRYMRLSLKQLNR